MREDNRLTNGEAKRLADAAAALAGLINELPGPSAKRDAYAALRALNRLFAADRKARDILASDERWRRARVGR